VENDNKLYVRQPDVHAFQLLSTLTILTLQEALQNNEVRE
jgi:hypothetical protein